MAPSTGEQNGAQRGGTKWRPARGNKNPIWNQNAEITGGQIPLQNAPSSQWFPFCKKHVHLQNFKIAWNIDLLDQAGPTPDDEDALSEALEKNDSLRSLEIQDTSEAHIGRRKKKLQQNQTWQASRVAFAAMSDSFRAACSGP